MTQAELNSFGVRLSEKESDYKAYMQTFDGNNKANQSVAASMVADIKFLREAITKGEKENKEDLERRAGKATENASNGSYLSDALMKDPQFFRDRNTQVKLFGNNFEGRKQAYGFGCLMASQMTSLNRADRDAFAQKAVDFYGANDTFNVRALSEGVGNAGGFTVPTILEDQFIAYRVQYGVARRNCNVVTVATDKTQFPRRQSGMTVYNLTENTAITTSQPVLSNVQLNLKTAGQLTQVSNQLLYDSIISIGDWIGQEMIYQFSFAEDDALFNGPADLAQMGIQGLSASFAAVAGNAGIISASAGTKNNWNNFTMRDFGNLIGALPAYFGAFPKFYMSPQFFGSVALGLSINTLGNTLPIFMNGQPNLVGMQHTFLGFPVEICTAMPTAVDSASGAQNVCYFGDMAQAVMFAQKGGIEIATSAIGVTFPQNATQIRGIERFDINAHSVGNDTTYGNNVTKAPGPLVVLQSS